MDIRFNRYEAVPKPITQAVMFCLMDVSWSMSEAMKDLAKRFFTLLYLFIQRRYRHVEIVFIRHTHRAEEVDEDILDYLQFAKSYVARCEERHGVRAVERVLDAAHALMDHGVNRYQRKRRVSPKSAEKRARDRLLY